MSARQRGGSQPRRLALLACLVAVLPRVAQAQRPGDRPEPDSGVVISLEPLTVTALGPRLTSLEAPYAVSVAAAPAHQPGTDLSLLPLLRGVPGVQVDDRANASLGDRISIRGFGARSQFGVRGVQILLDGIPLTLPDGQTTLSVVDPAFLEGAEVVRGPASALYGDAAGGAILLRSQPPPREGGAAAVTLAGGSGGVLRSEIDGGAGWTGGGARARLSQVHSDGYRGHSRADVLRAHGLASLAALGGRLDVSLDGTTYDAQNPGSLSDSLLAADRRAAYAGNVVQSTGESATQGQIGARWQGAVGAGGPRLGAVAYLRGRSVDNPIPSSIIDLDRRLYGTRIEVEGTGSRIGWGFATHAAVQSDARRNSQNLQGDRGSLTLDQRERVASLSIAARADARLPGGPRLLAAARYDRIGFRVDDHLIGPGNPDDSGRRTLDAWSPTLGASLPLGRALSLYANVATSFETPTTSELANRPEGAGGFNPALQPQHTTSVEAGAKGLLHSRLRYEVTAYRARVRDALVPFQVPDVPDRQFFRNAGRIRHRGVEASVQAVLSSAVEATASFAWTDARFQDYVVDDVDLAGKRVPGVAPGRLDVAFSAAAVRAHHVLTATWSSFTPVNDANTARSPGYVVLDYALDMDPARLGSASVAPFLSVRNVLDRDYNGSVVVNAFGGRYYEPAPGRTVTVGARVRLGAAGG